MGVYMSQPETSKKVHNDKTNSIAYYSAEMQGWRKYMEDAVLHILDLGDGNSLFAVFDGHGGTTINMLIGFEVSEYVKNIFPQILKQQAEYKKKNYIGSLDEAFRLVDQNIYSAQGRQQLKKIRQKAAGSQGINSQAIGNGTGCTANVVLITPQKYYIANAGDSRSVLCRSGKAVDLSQDHKPQSQIQSQRIYRAGGTISMGRVNGGLNLTRSFGDYDYKNNTKLPYDEQMITCKPDIRQVVRSQQDEFIIVGCDGIWEKYVNNSQGLIDLIKQLKQKHKQQANGSIVIECLLDNLLAPDTSTGIGCDNMSAILITFL